MVRPWLLLALAASGCIRDNLVACPGDVLCPTGSVCDLVHGGCVSPEQTEVCIGEVDHAECIANGDVGYCLDEICIHPGCGNRLVDDGELCDDGNREAGDGCSATCISREECGDGVADRALGEDCDDGNLLSRDGCDSRCLMETATWSADPIGPGRARADATVYDATRGKVVLVADGFVWAWSGTEWSVIGTGAPNLGTDYDVVFDPVRQTLLVISAVPPSADVLDPYPMRSILHEWDGVSWTERGTTNAPQVSELALTYDKVSQRVFAFGIPDTASAAGAWTLDVAAGVWTSVASPTLAVSTANGFDLEYDGNRNLVMLVTGGNPGTVQEWRGTYWSGSSAAMNAVTGWSLLYDATLKRIVAIGGVSGGGNSQVQSWNFGTSAWVNHMVLPLNRVRPSVAYDVARSVRVAFGGEATNIVDDVVEWNGSAWTAIPRTRPPAALDSTCAFDHTASRLLCNERFSGGYQTWSWSAGTWTRVPDTGLPAAPEGIGFDPIRNLVVAWELGQYHLAPTGWLQDDSISYRSRTITFDPAHRRLVTTGIVVGPGTPGTKVVYPDGTETNHAQNQPYMQHAAFDARNGVVVGVDDLDKTFQYLGMPIAWSPMVAPSGGYTPVENSRRGTVEFVSAGQNILERAGSTWNELPAPPIPVSGPVVFDGHSGELVIFGTVAGGISRFLLRRSYLSATPFESCVDGEDIDGDGLASCADPDCWATCTPACPPHASCP